MQALRHFDGTVEVCDTLKVTRWHGWSRSRCGQWHCTVLCSSYRCLHYDIFWGLHSL